jgi:hypothetical protein
LLIYIYFYRYYYLCLGVLWNLLDCGPSHSGPLLAPSESMWGGTLGTNPRQVSALLLGFEVGIGASGDCEDCDMSWESFVLFLRFLDLWWRWEWWIGFSFDLRVVVWC